MDPLKKLAELPAEKRSDFLSNLSHEELVELERYSESLYDYIPRVSPHLIRPRHLDPLVNVLDRALEEPCQVVISTPPQHGKTELILHAINRWIKRKASLRHAYVTYAADRAQEKSVRAEQIAAADGLKIGGTQKMWSTPAGGGVAWTGIGGPLTGYGINGVLVVDDPVKNRVEAESALYRERTDQWFRDVALTRCHPGSSKIVIQTRWHEDDLAGRLAKRGWKVINLAAIATKDELGRKAGEALWPEQRPLDWLKEVRVEVGEYTWWSLYQGEPRPRGGAVFGDAHLYRDIPAGQPFRIGMGIDCAYSVATHADWSVILILMRMTSREYPHLPPVFYVLDVIRKQVPSPAFKALLRSKHQEHPTAPIRWYAAGTEKGIGDFFRQSEQSPDGILPGVPVIVKPTLGDKFVRAQPVSAAWNAGRVLVPENAPWAEGFLTEIAGFTGINDAQDDQLDALAAAYDELATGWASAGGGVDKYKGFKPRDTGEAPAQPEPMSRPSTHATDQDKVKKSGRW